MRTLRRVLVLGTLMFWQGGLMVYGALVVPVARAEFRDVLERQAIVTSRVTFWLNLAGALALVVWLWDLVVTRDRHSRRVRARRVLWGLILATLATVMILHRGLDSMMSQSVGERDPHFFHVLHRAYLWVTTAQWAMAVTLLVLTLKAWQAEDAAIP
jgi:hypothetical protein